jgi:hypothetical protein
MSPNKVESRVPASEASPRMPEPAVYTVKGFCHAHCLSRSKFYEMARSGEGPRLMKCGTRTLISMEAAQAWRLDREQAAAVLPSVVTAGKRHRRVPAARRR